MSDRLLDVASELLEGALRSGADQAEVAIAEVHSADTRIENGRVHTAQTTDETAFGLRLFAGGSRRPVAEGGMRVNRRGDPKRRNPGGTSQPRRQPSGVTPSISAALDCFGPHGPRKDGP